ncbi:murein hydrolase activator EnvC family protein [Agrococcus jejuensis]|uniref:Peptidase family M23 n=1 Tax=Agrococcus jejuensis TaxID=399736 RepID=A0A1G8GJ00_9MICO|nr:peptidoglycan DD-metalloendopeptidase family protein [Agrococcus jejuensis]SDH94378.1 Peptidase family M23 [Agrococcus jejuensis]
MSDRRMPASRLVLAALCAVLVVGGAPPAAATDDRGGGTTAAEVPEQLEGSLAWPVPQAQVLRAFAAPSTRWGAGHRGIDVAAAPGETVVAATSGTVTFAGTVVDRPVVTVRMDGVPWEVLVTAEPVAPLVAAGDVVEAGDPIGTVVGGHRPCGACIHLGVRIDDAYANPMALLGAERAVLLPLARGSG